MAALVAGVQYGLSSHSNFHENKSLIFVKLTDSAYRAIEDYLCNRNKTSDSPTIQFLGNEGQLSFPSSQSSHGTAGFTFSLSGNQDIEGPQGSFECIQQTGSKSLESLGTLPCKMRIQAKDDVYEATRHRMAVAEENHKNKCTRVIKANGPDIGRKVKVKVKGGTGRTIPPSAPPRVREPPMTVSNLSSVMQSSTSSSSSSSTSSSATQSRLSSYKPTPSNNPPPAARAQPEKKISEIMRRPLKERLIHLLALRPYKKPELHERIHREGIRDREKTIITTVLKQVAYMHRDNTYHLNRGVWNDVQEDWPFYTEQDKTMLKRRKPQNLTPPGSSDGGSCGSGQSPNSTHPGSPPGITAPPPALMGSKRPGYFQGNDGLQTKRPRISHYRKPESGGTTTTSNPPTTTDNGRTSGVGGVGGSNGGGGGGGGGGSSNSWDQRQQREQRDYRAERTNSEVLRSSYGASKSCLTPSSDCEDIHSAHSNLNSHNSHSSLAHNNVILNNHNHNGNSNNNNNNNNKLSSGGDSSGVVNFVRGSGGSSFGGSPSSSDRRDRDDRGRERERERFDRERERERERERSERERERERGERERERERSILNSGSNNYDVTSSQSGNSYVGNNSSTNSAIHHIDSPASPQQNESIKTSEYPEYLTYYTAISSNEQKKRYKAEFSADYEEYRRLHTQVAKVSRRFAQLEEQLKKEHNAGNDLRCVEIRNQILSEYNETKNDPVHQQTKRRFHYLHEKLSHIKRLVLEYDSQNVSGGGGCSLHN